MLCLYSCYIYIYIYIYEFLFATGTTWMGQILQQLRKASQSNPIGAEARGLLYMKMDFSSVIADSEIYLDLIEVMPSPRMVKTHLEVKFYERALKNRNTKFVVIMRNVKDTLVSYYHFYRSNLGLGRMTGAFEDFVDLYKRNKLQNWFDWNLDWWKYKDHPNVIFFTYEDMKGDIKREVRRLVDFLGMSFADDVIGDICELCSFGEMSDRFAKNERIKKITDPKISPFLRKGQIGDWKNHFNEEDNNYVDDLIRKRIDGTGLVFKYEW